MKWLTGLILILSLQAIAQESALIAAHTPAPASELTVAAPAASSTTVAAVETPAVTTTEPVAAVEAGSKNLKETEIPVNLESAKKTTETQSPILKAVMSLAIIGILAGAAFYLLRKYRFTNAKTEATQIKILSQHFLGPKKSLAIVRVAGESVLIGITDHNISMIKSLSLLDEDIPEESPKDFSSVFSRKTRPEPVEEDPENRDEFSLTGIKDFVSVKLKNMRSLE